MALSVMANASKITSGFVGKKNVRAEIYLLRGPFEAPANPARSMSVSTVASTSASLGTGLAVASDPSRAILWTPGADRAARTKVSTALSR